MGALIKGPNPASNLENRMQGYYYSVRRPQWLLALQCHVRYEALVELRLSNKTILWDMQSELLETNQQYWIFQRNRDA
jgi:hypothetical protein